jgi:hypothetical protein
MQGRFRIGSPWDPTLILGQIICVQSIFYTSETILINLWAAGGDATELSQVFGAQVYFANNFNLSVYNKKSNFYPFKFVLN